MTVLNKKPEFKMRCHVVNFNRVFDALPLVSTMLNIEDGLVALFDRELNEVASLTREAAIEEETEVCMGTQVIRVDTEEVFPSWLGL